MAGLKDMLSKGVTSVNVKTSNFMEINKIKTYINTLNDEIAVLENSIGKKIFNMWKNGNVDISMIQGELDKMQADYNEIDNQEMKIKEIESEASKILGDASTASEDMTGKTVCPKCGRVNSDNSRFCVGCGNQLKD